MAYVISDECIACGACADECPVSAISEGDGKYVIDADTLLFPLIFYLYLISKYCFFEYLKRQSYYKKVKCGRIW